MKAIIVREMPQPEPINDWDAADTLGPGAWLRRDGRMVICSRSPGSSAGTSYSIDPIVARLLITDLPEVQPGIDVHRLLDQLATIQLGGGRP